MNVDSYLLKGKLLEVGKTYEFMGEVEQVKKEKDANNSEEEEQAEMNGGLNKVFLKARVLK